MKKDNRPFWRRLDLIITVSASCVLLLLCAILSEYAGTPPLFTALVCIFLALGIGFVAVYIRMRCQTVATEEIPSGLIDGQMMLAVSRMEIPALLCDGEGLIIWCNRALCQVVGKDIHSGERLEHVTDISLDALSDNENSCQATIKDQLYRCGSSLCKSNDEDFWFLTFSDETELEHLRLLYKNERVAVAYVVIDNIEELLQCIQENFHNASTEVEAKLQNWAESLNGVIRAYDNNKYIMFFDAEHLDICLQERFDILDEVREVRVGDGIPVTVSIGVSCISGSLAERERAAQNALDLALQRGGDQVVYKKDEGIEFFGGKTKAVYKKTNVRARVMDKRLSALVGESEHVLIMGHKFGDFDSFGSAVGMARFVISCGVTPHIVVNRSDPNLSVCFDHMEGVPEYEEMFISEMDAMDYVKPDTLLIMVDVNSFSHAESPALLSMVKNIAIIDHHTQVAEFPVTPKLAYIEPSASSASELVGEILEQHMLSTGRILKQEAEMMLSGILLDTKRFTRSTGTRTFGVARYLRGEGANPSETDALFKADVGDLIKEARFHSNVVMYRECVALAICDGEADPSYRVIAAKASDKLLSVRGVQAAFALVKIGDKIHISARSDGSINVQLILEKMHGGGHFDAAGAQVEGENMQSVISQLKSAIDIVLEK